MNDFARIASGVVGTVSAVVLDHANTAAGIFAGVATGCFMLISAAQKLGYLQPAKNKKDHAEET